MLCPKDLVQMHQVDKIGGGDSGDDSYSTWELKVCPACGQHILEFYSAIKLTPEMVEALKTRGLDSIEVILKKS